MNVKIENGELVIRIPVCKEPLEPSKSGKSLMVASSRGPVTTDAVRAGRRITVSLNAYIKT